MSWDVCVKQAGRRERKKSGPVSLSPAPPLGSLVRAVRATTVHSTHSADSSLFFSRGEHCSSKKKTSLSKLLLIVPCSSLDLV